MQNSEEVESYAEQLAAVRERLELAEQEMIRVRRNFQLLLSIARSLTEISPVFTDAIQAVAAGLDLDLDEDSEGEPEECEEVLRVGSVEMTIGPDGEIVIERPTRSPSAGSGL